MLLDRNPGGSTDEERFVAQGERLAMIAGGVGASPAIPAISIKTHAALEFQCWEVLEARPEAAVVLMLAKADSQTARRMTCI